jgi:hypothetical protein
MTTPPLSDDEYINKLYDDIRAELTIIFAHSPERAADILANFYNEHPSLDEDFYSHQGPFNMALRIHYDQILKGDVASLAYINWRKNYHHIWIERMN